MKEISKNKLVEHANRLKKQRALSVKQSKEDKAKHKASLIEFKETYVCKTEPSTTVLVNPLTKKNKQKKKDDNTRQFKVMSRAYFKHKAAKLRAEKKKSKRDVVKEIKYKYLTSIGLKPLLAA